MDNWRLLYAGWGLRKLGLTLITIFGPLYFYTHGYSLRFLFILLALQCLINGLARPLAAKTLHIFKPGVVLGICVLSMATIYGLTARLYEQAWPLAILFVLSGFFDGFCWSIYQYLFAHVKHKDGLGSQISLADNVSVIAAVTGLVAGGFIAVHYSIAWNYALAAVVLVFSALCMLAIGVNKSVDRHSYSLSIQDVQALRLDWLSGIGNLFDLYVVDYLWPIALVVVLSKAIDLTGYLLASATVLSLLMVYLVGKLSNANRQAGQTMKTGIVIAMGMHALRWLSLATGMLAVPLAVSGDALRSVADVPYNVFYFERLAAHGQLRYITVYEFMNNIFLTIFWLTLAILVSFFTPERAIVVVIVVTFLVLPMTALIPHKKV